MHLLVLSAFRPPVSDTQRGLPSLNAPSGAQCFPTESVRDYVLKSWVSMHLLVLSAFRPKTVDAHFEDANGSQCTFWCSMLSDMAAAASRFRIRVSMHLLVLSAFRLVEKGYARYLPNGLNAPSGAQCFPTCVSRMCRLRTILSQCTFWCSVLSNILTLQAPGQIGSLNAPSGAQCFPTR